MQAAAVAQLVPLLPLVPLLLPLLSSTLLPLLPLLLHTIIFLMYIIVSPPDMTKAFVALSVGTKFTYIFRKQHYPPPKWISFRYFPPHMYLLSWQEPSFLQT